MKKIRLLIVDEHPAVCQALAARLQSTPHLEVVGAANTLREGLRDAQTLRPDVILLELKGQNAHRLDPAGDLSGHLVDGRTGLIVLTSYADDLEREAAIRAGAQRYLLKDIDSPRLIAEIEAVAAEVRHDEKRLEIGD
ncbi:MAG: response regulator transcription factor [Chloroflexota bacterium]